MKPRSAEAKSEIDRLTGYLKENRDREWTTSFIERVDILWGVEELNLLTRLFVMSD